MVRALMFAAISVLLLSSGAPPPQFSAWSTPVKIQGSVNTAGAETCVALSKNGLTLLFARSLAQMTGYDLYVSQRQATDEPWGEPVALAQLNTSANEFCPALSLDEHRLYFASARTGGCGDGFTDIYVSRRHDRRDDLGWQPPENIGCENGGYANSARGDQAPSFFEDEDGQEVMYFASNRVAAGGFDIYESRMHADETFGPATPVTELNVDGFNEIGTAVRRDGLEVIVDSTRPGGLGGRDLWSATRETTTDRWSALINLAGINSSTADGGRLSMSFDGRQLFFASDRGTPGWNDIYVTTRDKANGRK